MCGSGPEFRTNVTFSIGMYISLPLCMYIIIQYVALVLLSAINPTYIYCIHHPVIDTNNIVAFECLFVLASFVSRFLLPNIC